MSPRPPSGTPARRPSRPVATEADSGAPPRRISTQFGARLAERRRALRRLRWRTIAIVAAAVLAVAAVVYLVLFSPVLALRAQEVRITGASDLVEVDQIHDLLAAHDGQPLVRLDTTALAREVEQVTGVLSANLVREWPHGVQVQITPRIPVATVPEDGEYLVLDGDAVELQVTAEPREDLPLVEVEVGTETSAASLEAVVTVLGALPPELFEQVGAAGAASPDQVELELTDGAVVVWGSAEENELKAAVLTTLRQVPAEVYDVSAPRNPITRG